MRWYFFFFLISGFCSVLYEVVWLRLAMAHYGVTTPSISIVLSVFMLGLGFGSWAAGRAMRRWQIQRFIPALRLYAISELVIGCSAWLVPLELFLGRELLEKIEGRGLSSSGYYLAVGISAIVFLLPWCSAMGATFPVALFAIEEERREDSQRSFSYLYLANVLGAVLGTFVPLLLIEAFGFQKTLHLGSFFNFLIVILAFSLSFRDAAAEGPAVREERSPRAVGISASERNRLLWVLFGTGLISMAAEVVWVRLFTPWLSTAVYAFATMLACYLSATYMGSVLYRKKLLSLDLAGSLVWALVGFGIVMPIITTDPRLHISFFRLILGVCPISGLLGFITPFIVDRFSEGDGERAGHAYAVNVLGCIIGPLIAGFFLLPAFGERMSLYLLALPWFVLGLWPARFLLFTTARASWMGRSVGYSLAVLAVAVFFVTKSYDDQFGVHWVKRDYTATVVAKGNTRLEKGLLVNGVGMTGLLPITKMMAHLPLAMLNRKPENILVICFGMGTTHRSALSWGIDSTVVELIPSVPEVFGFFHEDGPQLLQSSRSHLVIDDGRLFLERTSNRFDVIIVDPPPPVEAAGSSLLYSKEFYALVKKHLRPAGILQAWLPEGADAMVQSSVAKALDESFPNVRVFTSVMNYGHHFLASMAPIPRVSADELASRMPPTAAADMVEWGPGNTAERQFTAALAREIPLEQLIQHFPTAPALVDDLPVNEYYYLRHISAFHWIIARN